MIALERADLDVDDTTGFDVRNIRHLRFYDGRSSQDGSLTGFNDRGEVAFAAEFLDGTQGVFVSTAATIPEPSTALLILLAATILDVERRGR